jgi:hypothetical protein
MRRNPTAWNANDPSRNWHLRAFFGLHYDLHAGVKDTELGAAVTPEHLRTELAKIAPDWIQCDCKGHAGYTSWPTEVGTPSPGIVRDALRVHRDVTAELGIPLVMHYSGVWDNRAIELHPDWACIGPDGGPTGKEGFVTGGTCNLSAYRRELMIPQLLELVEKYNVDGFWVDGENWATKPCYCDRCMAAFTAETGLTEAPKTPDDPNWPAWASFHRQLFAEHVREYADAVHARKPDCLVCSNWMYTVGHPSPIAAPVDYQSGDFSWKWSIYDAMLEGRFMDGRGLSWDLMAWGFTTAEEKMGGWTFKPAAMLCQEAACVISLSGAFLIYNQPQRSGHLTGWHQDIMADVARFVRARQPWCQDTDSVPQVAVLHAASHFYRHNGDLLMAKRGGGHVPINGALHALLENGCSVDILDEPTLVERIAEYKLVVIPEQQHLPEPVREALAAYVEGGGKLLLTGANVAADFPHLAGVTPDGDPVDGYFFLPVGREATTMMGPRQPVALDGAETLLTAHKQQEPGRDDTGAPVVTWHAVGNGQVVAVHSNLFANFAGTHYPRTRALVGTLVDALNPDFIVEMDAPARLHLVLRRQPGRLIAHLVNTGATHPLSPNQVMVEDVPAIGPVTLRVKCDAPKAVYLAPSMEGLAWDWKDGLLTVNVASVGIMDSVVIEG